MNKSRYPGPWRPLSRRLASETFFLSGDGRPPSTHSYLEAVYVVSETREIAKGQQEWRERTETGAPFYEHDMTTEQAVLFRAAAAAVEVLRRVAVARLKRAGSKEGK